METGTENDQKLSVDSVVSGENIKAEMETGLEKANEGTEELLSVLPNCFPFPRDSKSFLR